MVLAFGYRLFWSFRFITGLLHNKWWANKVLGILCSHLRRSRLPRVRHCLAHRELVNNFMLQTFREWQQIFYLGTKQLFPCSPKYGLPVPLLMPFAYIVDWTCKQLAPFGVKHSQFTPTRLRIMSTTRTFNIKRANKLLGYVPPVPLKVWWFLRLWTNGYDESCCNSYTMRTGIWSQFRVNDVKLSCLDY